jgi:two-component system LytT family response regulator
MNDRLRCLLVDDEPLALKRLDNLLVAHPEIDIIGKISRPSEAVRQIDTLEPDLLFLDIQMPGMNGFEVLENVKRQPMTIFVTAYDRYALEAFEVNSVDYLLKPVQRERLEKAIQKAVRFYAQPGAASDSNPDLKQFLEFIRQRGAAPKRLVSRNGDKLVLIEPSEVAFFRAENKYTFAVTVRGEYILDYTLQQLSETLPPNRFISIHRSYIVNLDWIAELARGFGGGMLCRLKPPISKDLPISRSQLKQLRDRIHF